MNEKIRRKYDQKIRKRGESLLAIASTPEYQSQFREALLTCNSEDNTSLTGWLQYIHFDPTENRWFTVLPQKRRNNPTVASANAPFVSLARVIYSKGFPLTGEESPFSQNIQELLIEKFPQDLLPFEQVDYHRFSPTRWFDHPQFQRELLQAAQAHDPETSRFKHFWMWLSTVSMDNQIHSWVETERYQGQWANLAKILESKGHLNKNKEVKRRFIEKIKDEASEFPQELKYTLKEKFPADFSTGKDTPFYETLPIEQRLANTAFQQELTEALNAYQPSPTGRRLSFKIWMKTVQFEEESQSWVARWRNHGHWDWMAENLDMNAVVTNQNSPFPEELKQLIRNKFPDDFTTFYEMDYHRLSSEDWLRHPKFQADLTIALLNSEHPEDISFVHWLKTARPYDEKVWDADIARKHKTEPGPWKQLASYCEMHAIKRNKQWRDLFIGGYLLEEIQTLIIEKFPLSFVDAANTNNYQLLPGKLWLSNTHFQYYLQEELMRLSEPQEIGFTHWLLHYAKTSKQEDSERRDTIWGPWSKFAYGIRFRRDEISAQNFSFLFLEHDVPIELKEALQKRFPEDFLTPQAQESTIHENALTQQLRKNGVSDEVSSSSTSQKPIQNSLEERLIIQAEVRKRILDQLINKSQQVKTRRQQVQQTILAQLSIHHVHTEHTRNGLHSDMADQLSTNQDALLQQKAKFQNYLYQSLVTRRDSIGRRQQELQEQYQGPEAILLLKGGVLRIRTSTGQKEVAPEIFLKGTKEYNILWENELTSYHSNLTDSTIASPIRTFIISEYTYFYVGEKTVEYFTNLANEMIGDRVSKKQRLRSPEELERAKTVWYKLLNAFGPSISNVLQSQQLPTAVIQTDILKAQEKEKLEQAKDAVQVIAQVIVTEILNSYELTTKKALNELSALEPDEVFRSFSHIIQRVITQEMGKTNLTQKQVLDAVTEPILENIRSKMTALNVPQRNLRKT